MRRPSILDEVSIACEVQRSAGVFGFDALEIGSRLINRIPLQDQTLVDRVERGGCRRDGRLVLRDGGPVVAIINGEEGLARLDEVAGNDIEPPRSVARAITSLAGSMIPDPATSSSYGLLGAAMGGEVTTRGRYFEATDQPLNPSMARARSGIPYRVAEKNRVMSGDLR